MAALAASPAVRVGAFFGAYFAANAVNAYMPLWFADRGLSAAQIGQVLAATALLRVLAGPGWGSVADWVGRRRPVLLFAASAAAGLGLAFVLASDFLPILLIGAFQGLTASAINPLTDSLALALAREGVIEYGPVRSVGSATFMVTTATAGWLLGRAGSWLVPWLQAAGYGMAALLSLRLPEVSARRSAPNLASALALFRNPGFRIALACTALIQGAHAAFYGFAALYWRSQGIGDTAIGLLLAECIVAEILLFARGRRLIARLGPPGLTACAAVASILRWGLMAFVLPLPVMALIQPLHAATFAMQHLSAMMLLSRFVPSERAATAQAVHAALGYGAPTGLMSLLSGWLYARYGGLVFLVMAAVGGSALLLVPALWRIAGRAEPAPAGRSPG
ncbi:MAG TPA: MFS transporter [Rhodopila sp.]|uniref:MFS transporter n=1 Tax=Rhodopila sp. TaxID=2480087 RepID=UPI002C9E93BA|nr:MFS transporter [Rhodopila sp.]HVY17919.1 MFS transporter [Rhodopila sp.]